jgi:hypothetical protein
MPNIRQNCECVTTKFKGVCEPPLDTLAQLDHFPQKNATDTLNKRAIAKWYTNQIIFPIVDLDCVTKEEKERYWDTYWCVKSLQEDTTGKITGKYCKNRWCIVCNRIRTAILIGKYKKPLETIPTRFVTLTTNLTSTCKTEQDLSNTIQLYKDTFVRVWRRLKRRYGYTPTAIRKIEVTYSRKYDHFHPHFHVILENNSDEAEYLVSQWLKEFPNSSEDAQNIRVTDENTLIEQFKYLTKICDKKKGDVIPFPPEKLHSIFKVMYRQRVIQTYGNLFKDFTEDFDELQATVFKEETRDTPVIWQWVQECRTWIDFDTGEMLTPETFDTSDTT